MMNELSDIEQDQQLAELERELGPSLRHVFGNSSMRPAFAASAPPIVHSRRPRLRIVTQRTWASLAAGLAVLVAVGVALVAVRPQPADASEVLGQIQMEASAQYFVSDAAPGCGAGGEVMRTAGVAGMQVSGFGTPPSGPVTASNANELSDKLAAALGVTGDQVRAAMLASVQAELPTAAPPDPMDSIAKQLNLPRDKVCAAFFQGPNAITGFSVGDARVTRSGGDAAVTQSSGDTAVTRSGGDAAVTRTGSNVIVLNTVTADQLKPQALQLGVSPDQLLAAVKAALPPPGAPPKLPDPDEIIRRFAQNLGLPEAKVRAALTQVEGNHGFYFAVPPPNISH